MRFKTPLIIQELPVPFIPDAFQKCERQITSCCLLCFSTDQGSSTLGSTFQKNVFFAHEEIKGDIYIDNSKCSCKCTFVNISVESRLSIRFHEDVFGGHRKLTNQQELLCQVVKGPDEHQSDWRHSIILDLKAIQMPELSDKKDKKTGERKQRSPEDVFMAIQPQASCHARYFTFEYHLSADTEFSSDVNSVPPRLKQEISILPVINPDSFGISAPDNWSPIRLECFKPEVVHTTSHWISFT